MSIQDLRPNPQDTTNFYLANTYLATINPNASSSLPTSPPPFSPPTYAVWVNALWLLSLVITLTCALLANFLQKWAQRYLKVTQPDYSPHKRARIRAFFAEGVEWFHVPWTFEALPTLLHISLFLFFAGLVLFLANINITIFKLILSWVSLCAAIYGYVTVIPVIRHDSPYYSPLSFSAWYIVIWTQFFVYRFLRWFNRLMDRSYQPYNHFRFLQERCRKLLVMGMQETAEETALNVPSEIDTRVFLWTFRSSKQDHELERFFSGLPGFRNSKAVVDPLPSLTEEEMQMLCGDLSGFLDRSLSSDLLSPDVKDRRAMICTRAIDPEHMPNASILHAIMFKYRHSGPVAAAIAEILREVGDNVDNDHIFDARIAISLIIATRQPFDGSWYILASNELGLPETSLRDYAAQGDSLSLVILIHFVRQQFTHFRKSFWNERIFSFVLATASNFNVNDTSPELRHEFCALWNQIVREAQGNDWKMAFFILRQIRNVFFALHEGTDSAPTRFSPSTNDGDAILRAPSSYSVCKDPYHPDSTPHVHEPSTSGSPPNSNASPSPPDDVPGGHAEPGHAPSDDLNVQSSPYPASLRHVTLPTGLLSFSGRDSI